MAVLGDQQHSSHKEDCCQACLRECQPVIICEELDQQGTCASKHLHQGYYFITNSYRLRNKYIDHNHPGLCSRAAPVLLKYRISNLINWHLTDAAQHDLICINAMQVEAMPHADLYAGRQPRDVHLSASQNEVRATIALHSQV